jgi:hypothetical protein
MDGYAGLINNSFPTVFKGRYDSYQFDPSFSPALGINFLYTLPARVPRLGFGLSVGYNGYSNKLTQTGANDYSSGVVHYTTTYTETITAKNSLLATNLYGMFMINPKSNSKFYLKAGLNINFSLGGSEWIESESNSETEGMSGSSPIHSSGQSSDRLTKIKQVFLAFQAGAGVAIGKSRIEFCYWPSTNLADSDLPAYSTMQKSFDLTSMGVFYFYRLTR